MNKIEQALIDLSKANKAIKEINKQIGEALAKSHEVASDGGDWNPINKNKWLTLAYERERDLYESYFANHDDDVEGFLAEHCEHALRAHKLIQDRVPLRKALGIAKRRVTAIANRLCKEAA